MLIRRFRGPYRIDNVDEYDITSTERNDAESDCANSIS